MEDLIQKIRGRLAAGAYSNEAAVSHGIVVPVLNALGWDQSDPDQIIPEFSTGRGRVDFALCGANRRPAIFVEVKGVGRSVEGDRQLFEYAFHEGVPLCVLTDGREWSFYLPSGQGSYDDRRIYRLLIDDRDSSDSARVFLRYLDHKRVRSGAAFDDATADYRNSAARREAARVLPAAWGELVQGREELLIDLLAEKAEAICGFRPDTQAVLGFLGGLLGAPAASSEPLRPQQPAKPGFQFAADRRPNVSPQAQAVSATNGLGRNLSYVLFGRTCQAASASAALVSILSEISKRDMSRLPKLASAVKGTSRNHIARTVEEIYPSRPDLARGAEFAAGWLVGLNIANREKLRILQVACDVYGISFGRELQIDLPNT